MKKLVLHLASLAVLFMGLFPVAANAAPQTLADTWVWRDAQTIQYTNVTTLGTILFSDPDWTDGDHIYMSGQSLPGGCKPDPNSKYKDIIVGQFIVFTAWGTKNSATLVTRTASGNTAYRYCVEVPKTITLTNTNMAKAQYDRSDATTIQAIRADSPNGADNSKYVFDGTRFVQQTSSPCKTIINVFSDGLNVSVKHAIEDDWKFHIGFTPINGCLVESVATVSPLGFPENAAKAGGTGGGSDSGGGGGNSADDACANDPSTGAFSWVICPAIRSVTLIMTSLYKNYIEPSLQVDPLSKDPNLMKVWAQFRNVADYLFVLVFLLVIFSSVTSVGVSSYTIKKALPRVVAAAILVQFSWFLCGFAVDIGNVLGAGISSLVNSILTGAVTPAGTNTTDSLNMLLSNVAAFGIIGIAGASVVGAMLFAGPTLLFLMLGLLISLITLAATLVVRLLVLKVLIVLSPIAIVLWVLPNTESLFKKWSQNFTKLILMYPMIALLIAGGQIVQKAGTADKNNGFIQLASILAPMIAFFLIPATFKMAGTMMGSVSGAIAKRGSALSSRAQNSQAAKDMQASHKARGYQRLNAPGSGGFGRAIGRIQSGNGTSFGSAGRMRSAAGYQAVQSAQMKDTSAQFDSQQTSSDDLLKMGKGEDVKGFKNNEFTQAAAIQRLAATGQHEKLFEIKDELDKKKKEALAKGTTAGNNEHLAYERIYNNGISANKGDLLGKAPELVKGADLSYNAMSASNISNMSAPSLGRAMRHLNAAPDPSNYATTAKYDEAVVNRANGRKILESSAKQLFDNPRMKAEMSPTAAKALYDGASGGTSLDVMIRSGINADGTFK